MSKNRLMRLEKTFADPHCAAVAPVSFSDEERLAALTRLYATCAVPMGYVGDTHDHESIEEWARELAIHKLEQARLEQTEYPA